MFSLGLPVSDHALCPRCTWRCALAAAQLERAAKLRRDASALRAGSSTAHLSADARDALRCGAPLGELGERANRERGATLLDLRAHYWQRTAWNNLEIIEKAKAVA